MFYNVVNNASAVITSPHTSGDGILRVNPIGIFGSGGFPIRVTCVRQSDNATVIYAIGSSGATSLNITGVLENTADINLAANDICQADITAGTLRDIHTAIDTINASGGGGSSPVGTSGAIPIFNSTGLTEDPSGLFYDRTNRRLAVGSNTPLSQLQINTLSAVSKGVIVRGFIGQSANLFEIQNSLGSGLITINSAGAIAGNGASAGNLTLQSTNHATKGKIFFGVNSVYDEASDRLGIGTVQPDRKLHVQGTSHQYIHFESTTDTSSDIAMQFSDTTYTIYEGLLGNAAGVSFGGTAGTWGVYINGVRLAIPQNGFVGIGTIAPLAQLQVSTGAATTKGLIVQGFTSQTANLFEARNSSGSVIASVDASGGITPGNLLSLPTASAGYRGKIYTLFGGAGVADHAYMCLKNSSDTYTWVQLDN